jgi:hypothetical protein
VITTRAKCESAGGTFFTSTVQVSGDAFQADNLTFENTAGNIGQAVTITVRSDRAIFKRCRFLGDQDTLFSGFGRQYFLDSYIQGGVDFIFGSAAAVFDNSEIHILRPGCLTATIARLSGAEDGLCLPPCPHHSGRSPRQVFLSWAALASFLKGGLPRLRHAGELESARLVALDARLDHRAYLLRGTRQ